MALIDDARRRVRQSNKRLADLKDQIESVGKPQTGIVAVQRKRSDPHQFNYPMTEPLEDLQVVVSEVVQHLRTGLNYLVCALVESRGRRVDKGLQFLICNTPEEFKRRVPSELKGLSAEQVSLIETLQPYNGNDWLRMVRDLANPDKHRHPIKLRSGPARIRFQALSHIEAKTPGGARVFVPDTVKMNYNFSLPITFSDSGTPVIETLQLLQLKVSDLLDKFKSFFD